MCVPVSVYAQINFTNFNKPVKKVNLCLQAFFSRYIQLKGST